ncbi:uncharacterized protein LOC141907599 [Tubulanus polymorphus]|uniref:uncharacterized protein LOC141907599 n=1 Tax=Tubulanus polymorphus TaxID=672921 RepID=UPI003DA2BF67
MTMLKYLAAVLFLTLSCAAFDIETLIKRSVEVAKRNSECGCIPHKFTGSYHAAITGIPHPRLKNFNFHGKLIIDFAAKQGRISMASSNIPGHSGTLEILDVLWNGKTGAINAKTALKRKCINAVLPSELLHKMSREAAFTEKERCALKNALREKTIGGSTTYYGYFYPTGVNFRYNSATCELKQVAVDMTAPPSARRKFKKVSFILNVEKLDVDQKDVEPFCNEAPVHITMAQLNAMGKMYGLQ